MKHARLSLPVTRHACLAAGLCLCQCKPSRHGCCLAAGLCLCKPSRQVTPETAAASLLAFATPAEILRSLLLATGHRRLRRTAGDGAPPENLNTPGRTAGDASGHGHHHWRSLPDLGPWAGGGAGLTVAAKNERKGP